MQITPSNLTSLFKGLKVKWQQGLEQYRFNGLWDYNMITQADTSGLAEEEIVWADRVPRLREWVANKTINNYFIRGFKAVNKKFSSLQEIQIEDLERDNFRRIGSVVTQLVQAAANWKRFLVIDTIRNGGASFDPAFVGFDGVPTWSTLHPVDPNDVLKGTQANLLTTTAFSAANYEKARALFMDFRGFDGEPVGAWPDILMVPPGLEAEARRVVVAPYNAAGATNVNQGTTKLMVVPELIPPGAASNDPTRTTWYLWSTSLGQMPVVNQIEKEPQFLANMPGMGAGFYDSDFIRTEKVYMDVPARGCSYVPAWFLTMKCTA